MFRDIISLDHSSFLPLRFIFDTIVYTHKILRWSKTSKQPLVPETGFFQNVRQNAMALSLSRNEGNEYQ